MTRRPRILALAFACDPEYGSEAAGAWGTVQALSEFADVVVLVHDKHLPSIGRWLARRPNPALRFIGVPAVDWGRRVNAVPAWLIRRSARMTRYWAWQQRAREEALRLHAEEPFDLAIHAGLGMHWMPSMVVDLPMPAIWGPVGGGARSPRGLRRYQGVVGSLGEWFEAATTAVVARVSGARRTQRLADLRLVETEDTRRHLPAAHRGRDTRVLNRAILTEVPELPPRDRERFLAFTSPLESRKAPELALRALARTPDRVRLRVIHEGPREERLRRLARRLGISDRVEFRGRVPRDEMWDTINRAAACVFTGLREDGGCALAEAMLSGTPVIVLAHAGADVIASTTTDPSRVHRIEPGPADRTLDRLAAAMTEAVDHLAPPGSGYLDQARTRADLRRAVEDVLGRDRVAPGT